MPDPPEPTRRSSREHVPKKRLAESDDDNTSIDTPPSKTTINKRKSNADNSKSSKAAKTTTTTTTIHTSKTTEAEKIKNKALFNKFNSSMSIVVNKVGDVGYEFNKLFGDDKLYAGFVTEVRPGAAGGKDRRCVYEDGDLEDLSMTELVSLASNTDNTNNNNSTSTDGTSTSESRPALKFNNKTGDDRTTTGAGDNSMEVEKVNGLEDVEVNEGRDELLSDSTAVPTTNKPPEESSIDISGINGSTSTLTVTLTMDSSIAEKSGDTSCAATVNNPASVENVNSTTTTKDKGSSRRFSIGYKADSDAAIAEMVGKKDWSRDMKEDELAKLSCDGETVTCVACEGKKNARTGGVITMRFPYNESHWDDHKKGSGHIGNVEMMKARKLLDPKADRPKYQATQMTAFFAATKKKTVTDTSPSVAAVNDSTANDSTAAVVVDVTRETEHECAGVVNAFRGRLKNEVILYSTFCATTSTKYRVSSYAGLPAIVSITCTGVGVVVGVDGGRVCLGCKGLRSARGNSNPCMSIKRWGKTLRLCTERRERQVLSASDLDDAISFTKVLANQLGPDGLLLKEEAKRQVEYMKYMSQLDRRIPIHHKSYKAIGAKSAPGIRAFFDEAADLCEKNPNLQSSLIVALFKAAMAKEKFGNNAKVEEIVTNFYRYIATHDPKSASVLSANLNGPSMRWMKELNARDREECAVESGKHGEKVTARMVAAIKRRAIEGVSGPFSLAIDATKLSALLETSSAHGAILGAEHPNEFIDIKGMGNDKVREILDGKSEEYGKLEVATEVKVTIMTFQNTPPGVSPSEIVAARPQSNNESNEFIVDMERSTALALQTTGASTASFVNFAVDGVSCESRHVWTAECNFLSCNANHVGTTDTNHNIKSWRYQIIAGADKQGCTIGELMIDSYTLRPYVSMDVWCPSDFASDLLVLRLCSHDTILKMSQAETTFGSTSAGDKGALGLTLFFMRLHLYAVNGKSVPATHRAVYMWCSMLWLTSISGACIITKRNIVAETIAFMFIVLRADIAKPRLDTSEPAEHFFGMLRLSIQEFTCLEFVQLVEKQVRRVTQMYKHRFRPSRDPSKGYSSTYQDYYDATLDTADANGLMDGTVELVDGGASVAIQMWPAVSESITYSCTLMSKLFDTVGATVDERSPFCRSFSSPQNLRDVLIEYLPRSFTFDNATGNGVEATVDASELDDSTNMPSQEAMVDRIRRFASEMAGADEKDDGEDDGNVEPIASEDNTLAANLTDNSQELMTLFQGITNTISIDDILGNVLAASACLERKDNIKGSLNLIRKGKSLVQRWLTKPTRAKESNGDFEVGDILIERGVVLLVDVKVGSGSTASVVALPYRVVDIYDKYYNKWFMSKSKHPVKIWKKETKVYKLKLRLLNKNAINEYSDVGLCDTSTYAKASICRIIESESKMIVSVVGKLEVGEL